MEWERGMISLAKLCIATAVLMSVTGCASTQLTDIWQDPTYAGSPLRSIMVIGVTRQTTVRRIFEDEFTRQLSARGIRAVQSYMLIPEDGEVAKERLAEAVTASGVQGILITRWVKVERMTNVYPGGYWGPPCVGFYGCYSSAWIGFYDPPQVYTYDVVTTEINLLAAAANKLVWSGTSESLSARDIRKSARELAEVIIKQLAAAGLI